MGGFAFVAMVLCGGCEPAKNGSGAHNPNSDTILGPGDGSVDEPMIDLLMGLPSPVEMVNLLRNANAVYDPSLLNPIANKENYKTSVSQALNLGVYGADLSYVTLFDRKKESLQYFALTSEIAQKIGVGSVFTRDVLDRATNNQGNRDSLEQIFTETFANLHSRLEQNSNERDLALIISGGWVETIWLAGSIWRAKKINELADQIAMQGQTVGLLADLVGKLDSRDKAVEKLKSKLKEISSVYASMSPAAKNAQQTQSEDDGLPAKPQYTEEQIQTVIKLASELRKEIIAG
ncbi:MAG: hypothetical protein RMM53_06880 [Bacteroidia bacterium]|nr:hypothetical protein [Bacteroidia bacterium]